jgi:hypothetical protein
MSKAALCGEKGSKLSWRGGHTARAADICREAVKPSSCRCVSCGHVTVTISSLPSDHITIHGEIRQPKMCQGAGMPSLSQLSVTCMRVAHSRSIFRSWRHLIMWVPFSSTIRVWHVPSSMSLCSLLVVMSLHVPLVLFAHANVFTSSVSAFHVEILRRYTHSLSCNKTQDFTGCSFQKNSYPDKVAHRGHGKRQNEGTRRARVQMQQVMMWPDWTTRFVPSERTHMLTSP